jgi:predicted protein tyrosine phosphatase
MAEKVSSSWPGVEVQSAGPSRDADTPLDSEMLDTPIGAQLPRWRESIEKDKAGVVLKLQA